MWAVNTILDYIWDYSTLFGRDRHPWWGILFNNQETLFPNAMVLDLSYQEWYPYFWTFTRSKTNIAPDKERLVSKPPFFRGKLLGDESLSCWAFFWVLPQATNLSCYFSLGYRRSPVRCFILRVACLFSTFGNGCHPELKWKTVAPKGLGIEIHGGDF